MKTGVIASEPLGFYEELANQYDAERISTDAIRLQITGGEFVQHSNIRAEVNERARDMVEDELEEGRSVVYDGFLNTYKRREEVRWVAGLYGAGVVLMHMYAPMRLIGERIAERHANNELSLPSSVSSVEDTHLAAKRMRRSIELPVDGDEKHLNLDGRKRTRHLLGEVAAYIEKSEK